MRFTKALAALILGVTVISAIPVDSSLGYNEVKPGGKLGGSLIGSWTQYLVTCIGIVVTGTPSGNPPMANSHFMLHLQGSGPEQFETEWKAFQADVVNSGMTNLKGYLSVPDLTQNFPDKNGQMPWTAADKALADQMISLTTMKMSALLDDGAAVHLVSKPHQMKEVEQAVSATAGTMSVIWANGKNTVMIEGKDADLA